MEELKSFLNKFESERPDNIIKIYFSRRSGNGTKYVSHNPVASTAVQNGIMDTVLPYLKNQLESNSIVNYNPLGTADGELEVIGTEQIPAYDEYLESIDDANINKDMDSLKIDRIGFYCIEVMLSGEKLLLLRQFQKLKKLRQGFLTRIIDNELNVIENDFLGIDEFVDIVVFKNKIYLFNHIALERIFNYKDEFLKKTNEALEEIVSKAVITNIEQFAEDCRNDVRIMKRFTNIMTKERLPLFFENYEKVPEIVKELELDLDFDENGKMIYRERSQLFHIINLLSDSYFRSLLANRTGVAKIEGEL